jgi:hypothetical protein
MKVSQMRLQKSKLAPNVQLQITALIINELEKPMTQSASTTQLRNETKREIKTKSQAPVP